VARSLLHTTNDVLEARIDKYESETEKIEHRAKRIQHDARIANHDYKFARGFRDHGRKLLERSGEYKEYWREYIRTHDELRAKVRGSLILRSGTLFSCLGEKVRMIATPILYARGHM